MTKQEIDRKTTVWIGIAVLGTLAAMIGEGVNAEVLKYIGIGIAAVGYLVALRYSPKSSLN